MSTAARRLALPALAGLALLAPASAPAKPIDGSASAAKTKAPLRSLSVPRQALAGDAFTVSARITNSARRATRPRLVARIRKHKYASGGRVLFASKLGRLGAGDTRRYRVEVEVPESLAAGRYWLRVCVRTRGKSSCKRSADRLVVSHAAPSPGGGPPPAQEPPPAAPPAPPAPRYDVLAFTENASGRHPAADEGVDALREIGRRHRFRVTVADSSSGVFTESNLERYRAVVFMNTGGDVLDTAEQTAFENYFKDGGGFLGVHSAIATEPDWQFMTDLLGTRAEGTGPAPLAEATIKVADRVHDASKSLPEYWEHSDAYFNFADNVRGFSHVLATVDENTYEGGADGFDHPIAWCKDYEGGRSFYTGVGSTRDAFRSSNLREHLAGAVSWAAGESDPVYSDCGATVLANFQQTKVTSPPNLNEPIGFDQLPDGRLIQTTRDGRVRLHDPATGTADVIASLPVYTHSEDGLYGPAIDNHFATNKWVYLFYAPLTMEGTSEITGKPFPEQTPAGNAPTMAADPADFDEWMGYFQLSRFKFVDATDSTPARLDLDSEQKILKVEVNRGACCHVAGDIDFDRHNNLWLVTGDDTPAGSVNVQQFPPFNDMKTNESQTIEVDDATGGTFTLTFDGRTTAPIPYPLVNSEIEAALEALPNITDVAVTGNNTRTVNFRGGLSQTNVPQMTADASGLTSDTTATIAIETSTEGDLFLAPQNDARRSSTSTNDLRGKLLRIKVNADGSYAIPKGNLFPEGMAKTRPEIYAMGFRNPFRVQVDSKGVAYVTDYSPDSRSPTNFRGPAGTGRVEVVRKPSNYGWPMCYGPQLPVYQWDFNTQTTFGEPFDCDDPERGPANTSRWNTGLRHGPPITQPDIWYSYNDNASPTPQGTPCLAYYDGSGGTCPQLFPELGTGGVGPHGADVYEYDPDNPSETKFPPYYDGAMILGEFTRDWLREVRFDSRGGILKINQTLNCGAALTPSPQFPFECDSPMDMQFGEDGAFYLLTYGDGFFNANPDAGLYKWEYVSGSQKPRAVMGATPTNGTAPLTVQFSSEGSNDRDENDSIRFDWDFGVAGTDADTSTDPNPTYTYTANGVYTARLTVTDSEGKTDVKTIQITVGNTAPTVTVTTPVEGDFFEFGDDIPYTVTVTDPEDGPVDCDRVQVTFVLLHDYHGHAEASQSGCSGVLPTIAEDAAHGGYLAGGISVTYTDLGANGQPALTTTTQTVIQRRLHEAEFVQSAFGLQFVNVPSTEPGGGQAAAQIHPDDWLALNNRFSFANMDDQITFRYAGGANNVPVGTPRMVVEVRRDALDGPLVATCTLTSTGTNNNTYADQSCPLTGDVTGSFRVYLVFKQAPGGPSANMGNLNWVSFSGPGAGV